MPIREKRQALKKDIEYVYDVLKKGSEEARETAAQTLSEVKQCMKINYFDTPEWLQEQKQKFKD